MASKPVVNKTEAKYYAALELAAKSKPQKELMTLQWINLMMERISEAKNISKVEGVHTVHNRVKHALCNYDIVITINEQNAEETQKTMVLKLKGSQTGKQVIALEETYPIVKNAHKFTSHGSIDAMVQWLDNSNIAIAEICLPIMLEICKKCQKYSKEIIYKSIGTVSIVDMSQEGKTEELFDWLLLYQDKQTKFLQFRPINSSDLIESVSSELIHLFTDLGPPECIEVQPALMKSFENILTNRINVFFDTNIVLRSCNESTHLVRDVEYKLANWMICNPDATWSVGCFAVQWELNNTRRENRKSSFEKVFAPSSGKPHTCPASVQGPKSIIVTNECESKGTEQDHKEGILKASNDIMKATATVKGEDVKPEPTKNEDIDEFISHNPDLELESMNIEFDVMMLNINI